ncbi:cytoplasmic tRNA 2-thiolation protein 1 [Sceloporus undulatus]|uniref:cytoplasmic tRNA 2-thiolation protein 1 n=1 Tax=Sceloporus undulatus TaxID=8520 RepID=UPI001C4AAC6C|nr:cytoplasmic tRNA 2-thiolation protein 1 [Sceloporus undulatus]
MPGPAALCSGCGVRRASLRRPRSGEALCRECFVAAFEAEAHVGIASARLFESGETVAIAASGGKDSTVLAHLLRVLNERHGYGLRLLLLSVDEGIAGYRDESLAAVRRNQARLGLPLHVVSYQQLYGWSMDCIARHLGPRNHCTFCGVFRRQALDRGAAFVGADKIATGHNADDVAETVLMNFLRGDVGRLRRCTEILTGSEGTLPRCKPLKHAYEKEIVLYAYFQGLDYFSTECIYAPNAYRGHARNLLKDLEATRSSTVADLVHSGERLAIREDVRMPIQGTCQRCGYLCSQPLCKACVLLEGLNRGLPRLGIGKPSYLQKALLVCEKKAEVSLQQEEGARQRSQDPNTIDF